jgi:hypothetical protein
MRLGVQVHSLVLVRMFLRKFLSSSAGSQYEEKKAFVVIPRNSSFFLDPVTSFFSSSFGS